QRLFRIWIFALVFFCIILMFMPWRQNFRAKGTVTALDAADRPQSIHSTLPGRVEAWYVLEGDTVRRGDTIARLSEIKSDYFDPQLVERTGEMREAKENSAAGYREKADALSRLIVSLREERELKLAESENKYKQSLQYVTALQADLKQQRVQVDIAAYQERRLDSLNRLGLKSLTQLEAKRSKNQDETAKLVVIQTKLAQAETDVEQAKIALEAVNPSFRGKISKAESDRQSALTAYYTSLGEVTKLENQEANYRIRRDNGYIVVPQDGIVGKILTPGIGETVKEGEAVVTILPQGFQAAVELFIEPFNLPLIRLGQEVRFLFDGWPAVFFSGWPGLSYGTFKGEVVAIDNIIDSKGRYRLLVRPTEDGRQWPEALRPGSGAEGVALLGEVFVWYEVWRQLNAFPPDYYQDDRFVKNAEEGVKMKAPAKTVIK
ncbi:MAG: biotin/lipoyl-binding protein, partial [Bacteroidota bacterium]